MPRKILRIPDERLRASPRECGAAIDDLEQLAGDVIARTRDALDAGRRALEQLEREAVQLRPQRGRRRACSAATSPRTGPSMTLDERLRPGRTRLQ